MKLIERLKGIGRKGSSLLELEAAAELERRTELAYDQLQRLTACNLRNAQLIAERDALQAFAYDILKDHPEYDVDWGYVQDLAVKTGLLVAHQVTEPCGEDCNCVEYYGLDPEGKFCETENCYRLAEFVKDVK
jgi:hypothetical protein